MSLPEKAYGSEELMSIQLVALEVQKMQEQLTCHQTSTNNQSEALTKTMIQLTSAVRQIETRLQHMEKELKHLTLQTPDSTREAVEEHLYAALIDIDRKPLASATTASAMYPAAGHADRQLKSADSASLVTAMYPASKDAPKKTLLGKTSPSF
jgi:hypothetical protein